MSVLRRTEGANGASLLVCESMSDTASFAELYAPMTETELMKLARKYEELAEPAQAALRAEFARRGLEAPLVEDDGAEVVEERELVTVGRYRDMPEAFVARSVLESAGIECLLRDENLVRMDWLYSNMIGGMRLQVGAEDEAAARELLSQPMPASFAVDSGADFVQPVCPRCGSIDVMANDTDRKIKLASTTVMGLPMIVGLPALAMLESNVWKCNACGCKWQDDREPEPSEGAPPVGSVR
jgi:Putative prokaryotic signal transducing protein